MNFKLNIPYIPSRGLECGQACVAMIIKFFNPGFNPNFDEFNSIIHHQPSKYTFPSQLAILLDHYGIKAKCFSSKPLFQTEADFKKSFGADWPFQKQSIDFDTNTWSNTQVRSKNLFHQVVTSVDDMINYTQQYNLCAFAIDWHTLVDSPKPYLGHFVVLSGVDGENLLIHDPDDKPYSIWPKSQIEKAYSHPAINHDLVIAFGKK